MAALPHSSYRYKNMRKITFPDPIQEAQVMFRTKPEDMLAAHSANENFLQSISDYRNMITSVDMSNQNLFKSINDNLMNTGLNNMLPFSGNEIENRKRMDKLKDLFKNVTDSSFSQMGPALLQFLQTPEVKALIDQAKTGIDNRIMAATNPRLESLQDQLNTIPKPLGITTSYIAEKYMKTDLKNLPLFEISMDSEFSDNGLMKVFKELDCNSYFELSSSSGDTEYRDILSAVNEKQESKHYQLTPEFWNILTENKVTNKDDIRSNYLHILEHTVGDKLYKVINQFKDGQVSRKIKF